MGQAREAGAELLPGQARVLFEEPCPPDYMHHDHGYWMLRRIARRLFEKGFNDCWKDLADLEQLASEFKLLRALADKTETKPMNCWLEAQLGVTFEIKCPNCLTVFTWKGKFYAPQCPNCKRWLSEGREEHKNASS